MNARPQAAAIRFGGAAQATVRSARFGFVVVMADGTEAFADNADGLVALLTSGVRALLETSHVTGTAMPVVRAFVRLDHHVAGRYGQMVANYLRMADGRVLALAGPTVAALTTRLA